MNMNAPLSTESLTGSDPVDQPSTSLATDNAQRHVWHGAFGRMPIEVRDRAAFVNGEREVPMAELRDRCSPS
jgi:hypothetical protein